MTYIAGRTVDRVLRLKIFEVSFAFIRIEKLYLIFQPSFSIINGLDF